MGPLGSRPLPYTLRYTYRHRSQGGSISERLLVGVSAQLLPIDLRKMRVAMISTPYVPVPPPRYGGTELIVAELIEGLRDAGHEVTLFATNDSKPPAGVTLRARAAPIWPPVPVAVRDGKIYVSVPD